MARRIGNILGAKKAKGRTFSSDDSTSAIGDNATHYSGDGEKSVALTVSSQVTVKASNRHLGKAPEISRKTSPSTKGGWSGLKRLVGVPSDDLLVRSHSKSEDYALKGKTKSSGTIWSAIPLRRRILSDDCANQQRKNKVESYLPARATRHLDLAIRGRLDGVDVLSLGPASETSLPPKSNKLSINRSKTNISFDPLRTTFVGANALKTPADLLLDMIWTSGGKENAELIFEGYFPGGSDRWTVKVGNDATPSIARESDGKENENMESSTFRSRTFSEVSNDSTAELTEDGSTQMPNHMLWDHIWGTDAPPPVPIHMQTGTGENGDEEDVLELAAACSVPVDLDEDTFIIDSPEHFRSVLDIAMVPIQGRRFESGLKIFEKLLKGLEEQKDDKFEHLYACTNHNIGIILMCQSNFADALERFQIAVKTRTSCLPQNHPDVAVSLMRQGEAYFAMEQHKEALESFELALGMSPTEDSTRAKILNNIGVVRYHQEEFSEALTCFTSALEIQRQWLDGNIRRETIVYDASVTLGNMGKVFLELKEYEVAYSVFEEACLLQTTTFRKDHLLLLRSLENLALTHAKNGKYEKASPILRGILRSKESKFGADHPSSIETMGMLAFVLIKDIDVLEAAVLLEKVSVWQQMHLDPSHPSVKMTKDAMKSVASLIDGKSSLWI